MKWYEPLDIWNNSKALWEMERGIYENCWVEQSLIG
jgi:hypothetical protein